ncbi:hypothetical protein SCAB_60601 [Streptomyces scabiei 87.22]|uniref:Uncharacterized protein n=1 Tax=Streptomyces scabiei (strain 87.22) TaxID=680198 RepID=C9Z8Z0_STRSW|nr:MULTISPECIES: hypothetical protein [Streptomyces]MBP5875712.1 hypothetical protein [Streptomyces sp. LBUM 1477]MDX2652170.1 hypothetical protein [Streptomyces scabiei]MDX2725804.1 hypothetical protein [Streptomyces scabiei]MDX2863923.1 hypothetical protein [Streptomyces scabiei]MDX2881847.1 hypothetical protein [Streptomyces scabiei]
MSRLAARPRADHQHAASMARQMPGTEVFAGTYGSSLSATAAARAVRTGQRAAAYKPAGAFAARIEVTQDGVDLWVRYLGEGAAA